MPNFPFFSSSGRIGLDIGATAVRAAQLRLNPPTLVRVAQVRLPAGAVEGGEVRDADAVASALEELWHVGKFKGKRVHLGIGNPRVVVREKTLPWLSPKEFRESLPFQVQEDIPIPIDEAVLDYHTVEEVEQEGRKMARVLLVAAQKTMVLRHVEAVEKAKLVPVGIDIVPFAIVRSLGQDGLSLTAGEGEEAIVDVGSDITSITVHSRGVPRFVRILASGGQDITVALTRALPVSDEDAERLKRGENQDGSELATQASGIVRQRARAFVDEIRSSLDFYTSQSGGSHIGRVVLTGGGSRLVVLQEEMSEQMPYEVVVGRAFQRVTPTVDLVPDAMAAAEPLLGVAVGLALPGGQQ